MTTTAVVTNLVSLALGLTLGGVAGMAARPDSPELPRCHEDEILLGVGAFEEGRWSRYICSHPDAIR